MILSHDPSWDIELLVVSRFRVLILYAMRQFARQVFILSKCNHLRGTRRFEEYDHVRKRPEAKGEREQKNPTMTSKNLAQLISLAAIWGGSFIFMRVLSPVLGPIVTADLRVLIAGVALIIYFYLSKYDPEWRRHWRHYLVIGAVNSALPFFLYSYAALHLPASYEVILNSSSPLFGALFSAIWLGEKLNGSRIAGLAIGTTGVALITQIGAPAWDSQFGLSVLACLGAAACYGLAGVYIKKYAKGAKPKAIAGCSQLFAGLLLIPLIPLAPPTGPVNLSTGANVLGLALLCSAVAYLLYYRLVEDIGPTKALTVTFLMPVFGMIWGVLFLRESITPAMLAGCGLILIGTILVLRLRASG